MKDDPSATRLAITIALLRVPMWARGRWYIALCRALMRRWWR